MEQKRRSEIGWVCVGKREVGREDKRGEPNKPRPDFKEKEKGVVLVHVVERRE